MRSEAQQAPARRVAATVSALCAALATGLAASPSATSAQTPDVQVQDVERIISILASDAMRGREAFTEDADNAADYIADEFEAAGLEPLAGADGYLQPFDVIALTPRTGNVIVDGQRYTPDRFQVRHGVPDISWETGDVPVYVVGPDDDVNLVAVGAAQSGEDAVVLIDIAHEETYRTLSQIFRRPVQYLSDAPGNSTALVVVPDPHEDMTFRISADAEEFRQSGANVVGTIPGRRSDEVVLFSAHYDHLGIERALYGDSIANGANDNASGVTAVIELARHFASRGTPERTLLFAAFTAEEVGGHGSVYFSRQVDPDDIVAMFNIEMIGKPAVEGPNTAWITGFDRSSFGAILQQAVEGTPYEFYPDPYPTLGLFYRSDNATLARLGVPAHSISTTPIDVDQDYHQVTDELRTLDLEHLANTIGAIAAGAETIVSGEATPTRVAPEGLN